MKYIVKISKVILILLTLMVISSCEKEGIDGEILNCQCYISVDENNVPFDYYYDYYNKEG